MAEHTHEGEQPQHHSTELSAESSRSSTPSSPSTSNQPSTPSASSIAPSAVQEWLHGLLDLSRRNPLISLPTTTVSLTVDDQTLTAVAAAVSAGVPVAVRGSDDLDELDLPDGTMHASHLDTAAQLALLEDESIVWAVEDTAEIRRRLPDLGRRAAVIRQQTGANPLYLTLGAMLTRQNGAEDVAPLFLLPIVVQGRRYGSWSVQLDTLGSVRVNESLVERLRRSFSFESEVLRRPPQGPAGFDLPSALTQLREAAESAGLDAQVLPDARIALLEYSTVEMWRDLDEHWPAYLQMPLVRRLAGETVGEATETRSSPENEDGTGADTRAPEALDSVAPAALALADETDHPLPLPFDGSQLQAVTWAGAGRTFVLDGPPGTGKSQTIANVIADQITMGRRVLFVAEKDAAIDVVARRLEAAGLGLRCLDLRGKDQTARAVRTHLSSALARRNSGRDGQLAQVREQHRRLVGALAVHPAAVRAREDVADGHPVAVDASVRRGEAEQFRASATALREELSVGLGDVEPNAQAAGEAMEALREELRSGHIEGVHELIRTHFAAICQITPCLFMSPTSVSRYLPGEGDVFDLVLFDEASQLTVADAVPALGRSRAAVICGDPKQMPPADLFGTGTGAEGGDGGGDSGEAESILLEAVRVGVPQLRLLWHYRSRAESLVAFSNERYYGGELTTFPEPPGGVRSDGVHAGVEFRFVQGGYFGAARRKPPLNIVESNAVVEEVRRLADADPGISLGVVAFNTSQRDDILDKLESDESSPEVRAALARDVEPLFVKNLEHVQGDERDHILFSLTYSLHDADRLSRDYGLLRREGGERRLNVAVTRARVRNVLFGSWQPEVFDDAGDLPTGLAHLRDYVRAARDGGFAVGAESAGAQPDGGAGPDQGGGSAQETGAEVAADMSARLRSAGLEIRQNVGRSDFRVDVALRRPGRTWVAVLLDTPAWAQRPITADRDEIPYLVLPEMGWADVTQVYEAEWADNADAVLARLVAIADAAPEVARTTSSDVSLGIPTHRTPGVDATPAAPSDPVVNAARAQAEAVRRAGGEAGRENEPVLVQFLAADDELRGEREIIGRLPDEAATAMVADAWREVVDVEGPVHLGRAARTIARRFGWRRLPWAEFGSIVAALPPELQRVRGGLGVNGDDEFVWGEGVNHATYRVVRGENRASRKPTEIAPEERANAIRLVLAESGGRASESALIRGVREVFGFGFLVGQLRPALVPVIEHLCQTDELRRAGRDLVRVHAGNEPARVG